MGDQFQTRFPNLLNMDELNITVYNSKEPYNRIKVFFVKDVNEKNKVSNTIILSYIDKMKREAVSHSILILRARLNRQAEKSICLIEEETEGHVRIETTLNLYKFQESELLVNITDH